MSFCNTCFHPCHCGEEKDLHADEYGICTCDECKHEVNYESEEKYNIEA